MGPESLAIAVIHVTLDRPRELRLSLRSMQLFADTTGKDVFRDAGALCTMDDFRTLIWSMARETDPQVERDDLTAHINTAVVYQLSAAIKQSMAAAVLAGRHHNEGTN